jgi:hypothetical protein
MKRVLALLLIGAAGTASAQSAGDQRGFYVGAVVGMASYPKHPKVELFDYTLRATDADANDVFRGFTAGYRFGEHFALEAGYVDLGAGTAKLIDVGGTDFRGDLRLGVRGETMAAVVLFPFGDQWEAFVKGGLLYQDVKARVVWMEGGNLWTVGTTARHELKTYAEAGVSYRFDSSWKASLGLGLFPNVGDESRTGRADLRATYVGITYQF